MDIQKQIAFILIAVISGILVNFLFIPFIFSELFDLKKIKDDSIHKLTTNSKESINITKGICSLDKGRILIDTYDPTQSSYIHLPISSNQIGGAQYSYSFWLRRGIGTQSILKNKIIFYRGNAIKPNNVDYKKGYIYQRGDGDDSQDTNLEYTEFQNDTNVLNDRFIKCPLVRFGKDNNSLRIEFNSIKNPHLYVDLDADVFELLKSSKKNPSYNLISFSLQDNFDFGGIERGIKLDVFVDDALVKTKSFENNALRINEGPIVLFASNRDIEDARVIDADIVDLTYHNFALQTSDVDDIYNRGFKDRVCELPSSFKSNKPKYTYRKLNLYNETKQIN
jgi:hypothetical protein